MIKNYLSTTVAQERLGRLAVLPIEKDDINYSNSSQSLQEENREKWFSCWQGDIGESYIKIYISGIISL